MTYTYADLLMCIMSHTYTYTMLLHTHAVDHVTHLPIYTDSVCTYVITCVSQCRTSVYYKVTVISL